MIRKKQNRIYLISCSLLLLSFITILILAGCNNPKADNKAQNKQLGHLQNSKGKAVIYQVLVRLFGNQNLHNQINGSINENGVGKFQDVTDKALDSIRKMGVTHVWYTGVLEHATMTDYSSYGIQVDDPDIVKGRAGSPYAVKDYYDVDPDLAVDVSRRLDEYQALIDRTHKHGLKVLMDFIPNHVARNYRSDKKPSGVVDFGVEDDTSKAFDPHNDFYYLPGTAFEVPKGLQPGGSRFRSPLKDGYFEERPAKVSGNNVLSPSPSKDDWYETVKLNYGIDLFDHNKAYFDPMPPVWLKMRDILLYWAGKGVDGFRCDVAEMVPLEFWQFVIPELKKKHPNLLFIAEAYDPDKYAAFTIKGGFDLLYNKVGLYDIVKAVMKNENQAKSSDIIKLIERQDSLSRHMLNFLENHDEQRIASKSFMGNAYGGEAAMGVITTISKSPILIYFGQELGVAADKAEGFSSNDGRTTIFDYWGVPEYQSWVNKGSFDGQLLNSEQKSVRSFYNQLLALVSSSETISHGELKVIKDATLGDYGLAYIRSSQKENLFFAANLSRKDTLKTKLQIPLNDNSVIKQILSNHKGASLKLQQGSIEMYLPPGSFFVARLNKMS